MSVNFIMYFYMFICVALLVFNILHILRGKRVARRQSRRADQWALEIEGQLRLLERELPLQEGHGRRLERRLTRVEQLMAYQEAVLLCVSRRTSSLVQRYLDGQYHSFQALAVEYARRPAMERAFYAYLMSIYHPNRDRGNPRLVEVLMSYFDDSTVFCRENVLQALYAMGHAGAVEQAFTLMSERDWYHHVRLLSDGLMTFAGDKEALAWQLWRRRGNLSEPFQVATVQFATNVSDAFSRTFLDALQDASLPLETRFALLRYFQRRYYGPAQPLILALLEDETSGLAIAAAAALSRYPGDDTHQALMKALHSRNWYVRRNAAASLVSMGVTEKDAQELLAGGDRYAAEMLEYVLAQRGPAAALMKGKTARVGV